MNKPLPELQPLPDAERRHVAVVGAGLVGLCTALWLQRMGHRVMIIDPAPPLGDASYRQACSYGNACTFAPHGVVPVATPGVIWRVPGMLLNPLGPLAIVWRYLPQLVPWLRAFLASSTKAEVERIAGTLAALLSHADAAWQPLVTQAGAEGLKRHDGCLYLYKSEAQFRAADAENALRERHGVAMDQLDRADIQGMEPNLAPLYHKGVLFRDAYVFSSPRQLAFALAEAVINGGGEIVRAEVSAIEPRYNSIRLRIGDKQIPADQAVVAAGAHSRKLTASIGDRVLLDTERGYHVLFPQAGNLLSRPVCYPEHGFYMVPMADGLRAAGTVELGGLAAPLNPRRTAMIREGVKILLPAAGQGSDEWLGFRPSMPDSLPVIGSSRHLPRVTYAFGHGHLGLTLSALTGYLVSQLVAGQPPAVDLAPLRPDRF
ncbi:FAD-binding oxidoreductase [Rhizobium laguerreae]|uniref:NAD(P)/FAD-dependent oxidoreductase n=1 Tax=Rhizobium laguerreae TaxID=1076926 RepID=UPI001C909A3E|nr:FAD-binding oxidoreductase [Rhizobium laguerreae]MBY3094468.1 FAD-binding oxidoreductase [Rhizobium laguerreae]MBY3100430.1 FAD-binding oxidoreductase [Rhizobium laguerreae]MBY3129135.1 FAD-binding oxidoreductase [Rhizobium laguerreae]MBY3214396.1 FAD-binding oxidoreductase [Rhizobium laguerreae]MBY3387218.1 FAD-binding oxidoreductase [Rhizobium laguerreae]